jgi:hypothetical protein
MKIKLVVLLFTLIVSSSSFAKYVTTLSGPGVEITKFFTHSNGAVSLFIVGVTKNLDECTSTFRVYIPHDLDGRHNLVSAALMAFASGKKIGLHASTCSTTAFWGGSVDVPIIDNLWVLQ